MYLLEFSACLCHFGGNVKNGVWPDPRVRSAFSGTRRKEAVATETASNASPKAVRPQRLALAPVSLYREGDGEHGLCPVSQSNDRERLGFAYASVPNQSQCGLIITGECAVAAI